MKNNMKPSKEKKVKKRERLYYTVHGDLVTMSLETLNQLLDKLRELSGKPLSELYK